jgi:hypothetical protein
MAELYVKNSGKRVSVKLPKVENIRDKVFTNAVTNALIKAGLAKSDNPAASIHFDRAADPMEVLSLPFSFFESTLTVQQVGEIVLNKNLESILNGDVFEEEEIQDKLALKSKVQAIRLKMGLINIDTFGDRFDEILARLPTTLYGFLSPFSALRSPKFMATATGFARLFLISLHTVRALGADVQAVVEHVLRNLSQLENSSNRVFAVAQILILLLKENPSLGEAFSSRVNQLTAELDSLVQTLNAKAMQAQKIAIEYKALHAAHVVEHDVGRVARHAAHRAAQKGLKSKNKPRVRGATKISPSVDDKSAKDDKVRVDGEWVVIH